MPLFAKTHCLVCAPEVTEMSPRLLERVLQSSMPSPEVLPHAGEGGMLTRQSEHFCPLPTVFSCQCDIDSDGQLVWSATNEHPGHRADV